MDLSSIKKVQEIPNYRMFKFNTRLWLLKLLFKYRAFRLLSPILNCTFSYLDRLSHQEKLIKERKFDLLIILDAPGMIFL